MYKEICDFARLKGLVIKENRKTGTIAGYVVLDSNGDYHGIEVVEKKMREQKLIPDFGSYSRVEKQSNPIVEKVDYIFNKETKKHASYLSTIETGIDSCKSLRAIHKFLTCYESDDSFYDSIQTDLQNSGLKPTDTISFRIDGKCVEDMEDDWNDWLTERMALFGANKASADMIISSISGKLQESCPAQNGPAITNVPNDAKATFGLGRPGYIAAAKYQSYESYGFDKATGLQIGMEDAKSLVAGFEFLLGNDDYRNKDFKLLYFYDKEVDNIIKESLQNNVDVNDIDDEELEKLDDAIDAHKSVLSNILSAVRTGVKPQFDDVDANYYMVNFDTPTAGRCYLSNEVHGRYNDLIENLYKWYSDTSIFTGFDITCATKFYAMLAKCISNPNLKGSDAVSAVDAEFSRVKMDLLYAIYHNKQIPHILYDRALRRVAVDMSVNSSSDGKKKSINNVYVQIIKCYLTRKGYHIMPELMKDVSPAYACGRLFATHEQMQWLYNRKELNKNLAQSYFSAAMKQPAVIFPQIAQLGVVYFNNMNGAAKCYYTDLLGEISSEIGDSFPKSFDNDEQGSFILGYYQQRAEFRKKAKKQELESDVNEDETSTDDIE